MIWFDICRIAKKILIKRHGDRYKRFSIGIDPAHDLGINTFAMDTLHEIGVEIPNLFFIN